MVKPYNFDKLTFPTKPNWYFTAPVLDISASLLFERIVCMLQSKPRMEQLFADQQTGQLEYVVRSRIFRFPDLISIKILAISSEQSKLTIYSRAKYGYSDFGMNKKHVLDILNTLNPQ